MCGWWFGQKHTELKPRKCFICRCEDHLIAKCLKPPKDNYKQKNQVRSSGRGSPESQIECMNSDNDNNQNIYAYMAWMSGNDRSLSRDFGDSSRLTNWILDSGAMCHMKPQVLDFIPCSLEETDKHNEVTEWNYVAVNQKGQVQIKTCNNNGNLSIVTFHSVLLAPDLCNRLFLIITLMN